jgi:4-nitrophenyl phosphatase
MIELARDRDNLDLSSAVIIGDKLESDVACSVNAGIKSILVETGVDSAASIQGKTLQPTWVLPNLEPLLQALSS